MRRIALPLLLFLLLLAGCRPGPRDPAAVYKPVDPARSAVRERRPAGSGAGGPRHHAAGLAYRRLATGAHQSIQGRMYIPCMGEVPVERGSFTWQGTLPAGVKPGPRWQNGIALEAGGTEVYRTTIDIGQ